MEDPFAPMGVRILSGESEVEVLGWIEHLNLNPHMKFSASCAMATFAYLHKVLSPETTNRVREELLRCRGSMRD